MYYEHQTCNTQPSALALHPASPRSQREFCMPPGQVPQQSTSFQDFRAGDFKRVFLGKQNGTCAYTEAETGGLRAVRGGIQVFFWDLVLQMVNHSLRRRSKICKWNPTGSCSLPKLDTKSTVFLLASLQYQKWGYWFHVR